ncbi:hypothetical protein B0O80DRAFT_520608 [Mortierella sp. GBAus27b]|nr:hypothetical protein BGX31_005849 [Mortierella sp. GBA43]KAI8357999.1 hypothetical protein B0O80DRAFT_520608 [Mortierella sp. GBAus27b]
MRFHPSTILCTILICAFGSTSKAAGPCHSTTFRVGHKKRYQVFESDHGVDTTDVYWEVGPDVFKHGERIEKVEDEPFTFCGGNYHVCFYIDHQGGDFRVLWQNVWHSYDAKSIQGVSRKDKFLYLEWWDCIEVRSA